MIGRLFLILLAAFLASFRGGAAADERPLRCNAANSVPTTIARIMADREAWRLRCVMLTGISGGSILYEDVEAFYRASPFLDHGANDDRSIGLDNRRLLRRIPGGRFSTVTAIGRVQECEEMRAIANAAIGPDDIGWLSGYCHTATGPVLWLTALRSLRPFAPLRHMGDAARAAYGDLVFAPEDWPHRPAVAARAEIFLRALRGVDRRAFADLHDRGVNPRGGEAAVRVAFGPASPFAEIVAGNGFPQTAIFVTRQDLSERDGQRPQFPSATICFCRSADCTATWPISRSDADNRPERPYVCTAFTSYALLGRSEQIFITDQERFGLAEPAWTAFRRQSESSRR